MTRKITGLLLALAALAGPAFAQSPWKSGITPCVVPPMSPIKRLPTAIPADAKRGDQLIVLAAQGEYEPASFMLFSEKTHDQVTLTPSALKSTAGEIPVSAIDIKIVKCWYQGGTAWASYFADPTKRELVPELLLNDDSLIKVDYKHKDNYIRFDYPTGSKYVLASGGHREGSQSFNHCRDPIADSKTLKPFTLNADEGKQIWITVKVPEQAKAGVYNGTIALSSNGQSLGSMKLRVRVLPFQLPEPLTYYDLDKKFYASMYNSAGMNFLMSLGATKDEAEKKLLAEFKNMHEHGCDYPLIEAWNRIHKKVTKEQFISQLNVLKKSGLQTKPVFGALNIIDHGVMIAVRESAFPPYKKRVDEALVVIKDILGHTDVYPVAWDEPAVKWLINERRGWKYVHEKGANIMSTSKDKHLIHAGFNEDFSNYGGWVGAESARKWHAIGGKVATYASPHTGPENPDYMRRSHGMALYKADLDGTCNYRWDGGADNWNEFRGGTYRKFCMVYPTKDDVIDTLAWEGFREAIDDIRYATLLRQLAFKAIETGNVDKRYAGKLALQWLALLDENTADLNTMRLEMVNYILKIQAALEGGAK